jgi:hypothetical protein
MLSLSIILSIGKKFTVAPYVHLMGPRKSACFPEILDSLYYPGFLPALQYILAARLNAMR